MPDEATLEALEAEIAAMGAGLARRMARWLGLVAEFDRRAGAKTAGFRSTSEWLAWRCDIGIRTARDHVRVARRLAELPAVRAAFARGELSYSKVRAITRADAVEDDAGLLELASRSTADQLERAVRALRTAPSADLDQAARAHARRRVDCWWQLDGTLGMHATLPPDEGAQIMEALDIAAEALHPPDPNDPEGRARPALPARRADALAETMRSGAPRAQVVLHVDPAALACTAAGDEPRLGEICAIHRGPAVPSETARRLSCDAEIHLATPHARDLGRSRRVVSPALRRTLEHRDDGCRFPGCTRRHGLHAHHLTHWAHGGPTDKANLLLVCPYHHRLLHEEGYTADLDGDRVEFRTPSGRVISALPPPAAEEAA